MTTSKNENVEIDCSVFPAHHAHGGFPSYGKGEPAIIDVNGKQIKGARRDLDAGQPMVPGLSAARKFKSYYGLSGAEKKLRSFLSDFKFTDIATAEATYDWSKAKVITLK